MYHKSRNVLYKFYLQQLRKLEKIGIGKKTEHNIVVTEKLINATKKRLRQLEPFTNKYVRTERK